MPFQVSPRLQESHCLGIIQGRGLLFVLKQDRHSGWYRCLLGMGEMGWPCPCVAPASRHRGAQLLTHLLAYVLSGTVRGLVPRNSCKSGRMHPGGKATSKPGGMCGGSGVWAGSRSPRTDCRGPQAKLPPKGLRGPMEPQQALSFPQLSVAGPRPPGDPRPGWGPVPHPPGCPRCVGHQVSRLSRA